MSWKYISMASWIWIFLARKISRRSTFHTWWKHRPRLGFTTFRLIQIMPVSGWSPNIWDFEDQNVTKLVFKTGALILSHIYIMYIIIYTVCTSQTSIFTVFCDLQIGWEFELEGHVTGVVQPQGWGQQQETTSWHRMLDLEKCFT